MSAAGPTSFPRLLGGHVAGRPHVDARLRRAGNVQLLGQPEVSDLEGAVFSEQNVGWLQVAVDHLLLMGGVYRARQGLHQASRFPGGRGVPWSWRCRLLPPQNSREKKGWPWCSPTS